MSVLSREGLKFESKEILRTKMTYVRPYVYVRLAQPLDTKTVTKGGMVKKSILFFSVQLIMLIA